MKKLNSRQQFFMLKKTLYWYLLPFLFLLFFVNGIKAQQTIGSFPYMDGGFENQTAGNISGTLSTTAWSVSSTTNSSTRLIINDANARTGAKYASHTTSAATVRLQSPYTTTVSSAPVPNTQYTIQYYYKTTTDQTSSLQGGIYNTTVQGNNSKSALVTSTYVSGVWTKAYVTLTTNTDAVSATTNLACVRHLLTTTSNVQIDDYVIYPGTLDTSAPDAPTAPTTSNPSSTSITVSWTAPGTGVDNGGYMVVRGTADPTTTPNTNGIYAIGNTVATGETVVYIGTAATYTDGLVTPLTTGTRYYYRIYTVDKAFNYSTALTTNTYAGALPSITTNAASAFSTTGATFNGNISSNGGLTLTERGFCYKTSSGVSISDNKTAASGTATGAYTSASPTLGINTQLFYKAYATNNVGTALGNESSFYTLADVPSAPTLNGATSTSIDVAINSSTNPSNTQFAINETTTGNYVQADGTLGATAVWQTASTWGAPKTVTGLAPSTSYTLKVKARNGDNTETAYSATASLSTTSGSSPTLSVGALSANFGTQCLDLTAGPSNFTITGSLLTGDVTVAALTGFSYSTTSGGSYTPTLTIIPTLGSISQVVYVKFMPTAIQSYDGNIAISGGGASPVNRSVTGSGINTLPTVTTTSPAASITNNTVTLSGNVSDMGCQTLTAVGICYGTSANPVIAGSHTSETAATGTFSSNITGLTALTLYHFRAYATSSAGTSYGSDFTFTTISNPPTAQASSVTFTNFTSTGSSTSGVTINWSAGDGTNHIVLVKSSSAVDSNPSNGISYTSNLAFGSGNQIGTGNYVVFNGAGTSASITGLTKGTTYYVKIYTFNGNGGTENYLTSSSAAGSQQAFGTITSNGTGGGTWATTAAWSGGTIPGQYDDVTIVAGDLITVAANTKCNNLTINAADVVNSKAAGKIISATSLTLSMYGTSLVCNGTFGDASNTTSLLQINFGNNLIISGTGNVYPYKIAPLTGVSNIGLTFNANTTVTYGTVSMQFDNTGGNDNITYTIGANKTVTVAGAFSTTSSQTGIGSGNETLKVYGTLSIGGTLNTTVASGKTYSLTVYEGGLIEVAKTTSAKAFNLIPSHAVQNATYNVNFGGELKVYGLVDCSSTSYTGAVIGEGTFSTAISGLVGAPANPSLTMINASGLDATTGPIRTTTVNFDAGTSITYSGTSAQNTGDKLPSTLNGLTINNAAGVTLTQSTTINGTLTLTAGTLFVGSGNTITLKGTRGGTGSIDGASGTIVYAGTSASQTSSTLVNVNNLVINNTASTTPGVTLGAATTVNGTLTMTAGAIFNSTNNLTLANGANIVCAGGTFSTGAPVFGTSVNLTYTGSAAKTTGYELPSNPSVLNNLTINNTAGVTLAGYATASNLTINSLGILNVNAGKQLTVNTTYSNSGTINLLSDNSNGVATILTPSTIAVTGTTNVQQYLTAGRNWYISSPVSNATSNVFNASANVLYSYDETNAAWPQITDNITGLGVMTGYVTNVSSNGAVSFTGTLNNGSQQIGLTRHTGVTKEGFNLIGNPYPSYLNFESAIASASTSNVSQTMWLRSRNGDNTAYIFDTYNALSHIGTSNNNNSLVQVTGNIPPMQAFWVRVADGQSTGTLAVDNSMRSHQDQSVATNRFKAPTQSESALHLKVTNGTFSDEAIVLFNSNASNNFDAYDSEKMTNANTQIPEIYTLAGTEQLVINGLNSIQYDTEIPLGFTAGESNTFSIKASEFNNFTSGTQIILRDKLLNVEQDLSTADYSFTSEATSTDSRFALVFRAPSVATDINAANNTNVWISTNANNQLMINGGGSVVIYNSVGQKITSKNLTSNNTVIETPLQSGVYLINVTNAGKSVTQKVIIK